MTTDPIDRLFEVPPDEFVRERDRLVRSLKEEGQQDLAAEAKTLRRPTLQAWALNQLVRRRREDVVALLEAGEEVRRVQRGADAERLRRASHGRRELIGSLVGAAGDIIAERATMTEASRRAVETTLDAASADPTAAEELLGGRLTRPIERPTGFDAVGGLAAVPGTGGEKPDPALEARAQEDRLHRALEDARRHLEAAENDVRRAEMRARTLQAEAEKLAARAREAREQVEATKAARSDAKRKLRRAERALEAR